MAEQLLQPPPDLHEPAPSPSVTELVSGIINDAEKLFKQQVEMVRVEVRDDLRRTKEAAQYIGVGIGITAVGGLFLMIALVFLLKSLVPSLPEWACWAIVGGVFLIGGVVVAYVGKRIFDSFNPLPDQSAEALQENISCLTNGRK